jgi:hypothetical protein
MVRSEGAKGGKRGTRAATLLEIETFTEQQLYTGTAKFYDGQKEKRKFLILSHSKKLLPVHQSRQKLANLAPRNNWGRNFLGKYVKNTLFFGVEEL